MKTVSTMGELLIDFVPFDETKPGVYEQKPGGAPANVATTIAILGGNATFYGAIGKDVFGDFLIEELQKQNVNTSHIKQTKAAKTGLAFVTLDKDGNRSFHFYRNPSADMLYSKGDYLEDSDLEDIFAFSSVSLIDYPIKDAHMAAIDKIKRNKGLLVFDTNIRLHLWENHETYRNLLFDFIQLSDIVKIADDEIGWLTQTDDLEEAIQILKAKGVKMLLLTKGKNGACIHWNDQVIEAPGYSVKTVDTTGAGDAFLGAFLYQLSRQVEYYLDLPMNKLQDMLRFANAVAALSTTKKGALSAIPDLKEVESFLKEQG
ncbi:MAG: carbohydrate kinase [Bacilli bacterium]|nr:carbohydrate kinase [Bacilli bacterium]MBN2876783.1 carbohydrate kinase [Bacilli bacterium]